MSKNAKKSNGKVREIGAGNVLLELPLPVAGVVESLPEVIRELARGRGLNIGFHIFFKPFRLSNFIWRGHPLKGTHCWIKKRARSCKHLLLLASPAGFEPALPP